MVKEAKFTSFFPTLCHAWFPFAFLYAVPILTVLFITDVKFHTQKMNFLPI